MQPTPQIIVRNFEQCERILCTETGTLDNLNLSSIITRLIQDVGRFCERFASDFIISWDMVRKQLEPRPVTEPYYTVEIFGIRRAGVDHNMAVSAALTGSTASVRCTLWDMELCRIMRKLLTGMRKLWMREIPLPLILSAVCTAEDRVWKRTRSGLLLALRSPPLLGTGTPSACLIHRILRTNSRVG